MTPHHSTHATDVTTRASVVASDAALFLAAAAAAQRETFTGGCQCCSVFKFVFSRILTFVLRPKLEFIFGFVFVVPVRTVVRPIHNHNWVGHVDQRVINVMARQSRFQQVSLGFFSAAQITLQHELQLCVTVTTADDDDGGSFLGGPQDCTDVGCECSQAGVVSPSTKMCGS